MRILKKLAIAPALLCILVFSAVAGEIRSGSVPGSINYQGRIERDNTPVTGDVRLNFRIYNAATGGTLRWPTSSCPASAITATATQGIFNASISPCWEVFSRAEPLYLELQIENDVLSPREPLNSVPFALVAGKIEDGSSISVTTLTASYQVLLATVTGNVGIGVIAGSPDKKLTVAGGIRILSDALYFPDGTQMNSAGVGAAASVSNPSDAVIIADNDNSGSGDIIINTYNTERARITASAGNFGLGTAVPSERLEVNGNIANTSGNLTIYPRDYLVSRPKTSSGAVFRLMPRDNYAVAPAANSALELYTLTNTSIGTPADFTRGVLAMTANGLEIYQEKGGAGSDKPIIFKTGAGVERMRITTAGNVGAGGLTNPTDNFQSAGDISANTGVRGGRVSIGDYSTWTNLLNEVRAESGYPLLLQQTNSYNVGIGTDNPKEKLHVHGSVMADYGVIAATAAFSGAVNVNGDLNANSGLGNMVRLSSTTIYGTLTVTGGIGSSQGLPAYLVSTQTFTGQNTFANRLTVSSNIVVANRVGVGAAAFNFSQADYLQIGDGLASADNASAYLVSGAGTGNAKLYFYRGGTESAHFETQNGANLALVVGNTKSLVDSAYYRIYNSVFWVSTGTNNSTPALFVSSYMGNVGVGTAVLDPNWKLTVNGNIRITGASNGLIFADGTTLNSANLGGISVGAISHNDDAVVQSDADLNNTGKVVLRAGTLDGLVLNTGGNVGIGTLYPVSKLNIRGGDLVLGTPSNPYANDSKEDLIVGGNLILDGSLEQRSAATVIFNALIISNNVYLSTAAAGLTGIGTMNPQYKLDVAGDINLSGVLRTGGTQRISATGVLTNTTWNGDTLSVPFGGTGATSLTGVIHGNGTSAFTAGNVVLTSEVSGILPVPNGGTGANTLTGIVHSNGTSAFTAGNVVLTSEVSGILPAANGGTGANLSAATAGAVPYFSGAGVQSALAAGAANYLLQANGAASPSWTLSTSTASANSIVRRDANGDFAAHNITAVTFGGTVSTATNILGGGAGYIPYQSAADTTSMVKAAPAVNYVLISTTNGTAPLGWALSTSANIGDTIVRRDASGNFTASTITANQFNGTTTGGSSYIQATVGTNDYIRVKGGATDINAGYLEIATADDGTEPIYVQQYQDNAGNPFGTLVRTATLLDGSGNTTFPGYVFAQYFNMNADVKVTQPEYLVGEWAGDKYLRYVSPSNVTVSNSDATDGLHAAADATAAGANQLVRVSNNTYTYLNWINTTSGDNGTTAIARVYASMDGFIRYYTLANFTSQIQGAASGSWGISVTGNAATATKLAANPANCGSGEFAAGISDTGAAEGCVYFGTSDQLTSHINDGGAHGATDANTASAIVLRNASGNFSAGTITATLNGNANNVTGVVAIGNGGTGQTTAGAARSALGAAASGANSDITSLTGLTTDITVAQGGTGSGTAAGARGNLGAAASGANSDITSLTGITTALSVAQGGTGATTPGGARGNLGAAASGANSDITSLTGITTALSVAQGGTGATTPGGARGNLGVAIGSDVPSPTGAGASGTWGISISGTAAKAAGGTGTTKAVCWKTATTLGYCSTTPDASGVCTCN